MITQAVSVYHPRGIALLEADHHGDAGLDMPCVFQLARRTQGIVQKEGHAQRSVEIMMIVPVPGSAASDSEFVIRFPNDFGNDTGEFRVRGGRQCHVLRERLAAHTCIKQALQAFVVNEQGRNNLRDELLRSGSTLTEFGQLLLRPKPPTYKSVSQLSHIIQRAQVVQVEQQLLAAGEIKSVPQPHQLLQLLRPSPSSLTSGAVHGAYSGSASS